MNVVRRFFLLEKELSEAVAADFRAGRPGWDDFERARGAREIAVMLAGKRFPLDRSDGTQAAILLFGEAIEHAARAHLATAELADKSRAEVLDALEAAPVGQALKNKLTTEVYARARELCLSRPFAKGPAPGREAEAAIDALRAAAAELLDPLEQRASGAGRVRVQRFVRLATATALLAALLLGGNALIARSARGKLISTGKRVTFSTVYPGQSIAAGAVTDGVTGSLGFHTSEENGPWMRIDLETPQLVRRVRAHNRPDCCQDRAVPMIVEVSKDGATWTKVAQQDSAFEVAQLDFPPVEARYVRLRVEKRTFFHLAEVEVWSP